MPEPLPTYEQYQQWSHWRRFKHSMKHDPDFRVAFCYYAPLITLAGYGLVVVAISYAIDCFGLL